MTLTDLRRSAARRAFDRAAGNYDRFAVLQQEVASRLLERVEYFNLRADRILDLGCGTGRAGSELARMHPGAEIIGLDWAPGMLRELVERNPEDRGVRPVLGDMQRMPIRAGAMDLVFSNLAVQWSNDEAALFNEVRRVLRPGGLFLFSSFGPETLHELRSSWAAADEGTHVHRFSDLRAVGDRLVAAGFREPVMDMDTIVLEYADAVALMRDLKAIGAHNAARSRHRGLTGKDKLRAVLEHYERYRRGGRLPASYEVVYGAAFEPREGQPLRTEAGDVAVFSVDSLRRGSGRS